MPLEQGSSRGAVSANIKREMSEGKPQKQAIAIALKTAGLSNQDETYSQAAPESLTLQELNNRNRQYWEQPGGQTFSNGEKP